ncbi:DUF1501 domain-containing protein [Luteimonas sp. SX5]|uniref:DUF1501 domain-containing protein n=1 Tax=Luteimonas galliterrae TaxID=2940486 RepID=A0ABT0MKH9_9GAMM|nr:DUF1501 domain-containing protein [Luteimonas galliterrae]MCL1635153.1 DUF1501 domain-containing protein [Luteimonas galliterrae]
MKRREFLRNAICAGLGGAGLYTALGNLRLLQAATSAYGPTAFSDYKALVCVFMFGGNDALNMAIPRDNAHYTQYANARATLAVPQANLLPLTPQAGGGASDGADYGLQKSTSDTDAIGMAGLQQLFNNGKAALLGNVGTLIRPVTKAEFQNGSAPLPPQLFSHNDQQSYWQVSRTGDAQNLGWGGRIADLLHDANPDAFIPMSISLNFESALERAANSNQYVVGSNGPRYFSRFEWNSDSRRAFLKLMDPGTKVHAFERSFANSFHRARENADAVGTALDASQPLVTPFPDNGLARQLKMVARLIKVRAELGLKRQIYFVSMGGFDHHDRLLEDQPVLLSEMSQALKAFYDATVELGVANNVTAFTASDFGRTLSSNGDGSDHGWGAHHFVVGGAVKGGRFYGRMPALQNNGPDDAGWGQIIPTTSVDQYAATLARWFGVADTDLDLIFPNLGNFASRNLGFMV